MNYKKYIYSLFLLFLSTALAFSQAPAIKNDKLSSILTQLPASTKTEETKLYSELIGLDAAVLGELTSSVVPNGNPAGVKSRYAVSLLTHTATSKEDKAKIESSYLAALKNAADTEVKAYFIDNLKLVGSAPTVAALKTFVEDKDLVEPTVTTVVTIGGNGVAEEILAGVKPTGTQLKIIKALGRLKYVPAVEPLTKLAQGEDIAIKKQALWALAQIADPTSAGVLQAAAKQAGYKNEATEATVSLIEFLHQQTAGGNTILAKQIANEVLANTPDSSQKHFRLAALSNLVKLDPTGAAKILVKESTKFDLLYQKEILKVAKPTLANADVQKLWTKEYKKATGSRQGDILSMIASSKKDEQFATATLIPALSSSNADTRIGAVSALAATRNKKFITPLVDYLLKSKDDADLQAAQVALQQLMDKSDGNLIAQKIDGASPKVKAAIIKLLASKRSTESFASIAALTASTDAEVKAAAYEALPNISSPKDVGKLLDLLAASNNEKELTALQGALNSSVDRSSEAAVMAAFGKNKVKTLPVLPYIGGASALEKVLSTFKNGNDAEKQAAFDALTHWQNADAIRPLLAIAKDQSLSNYHAAAFDGFLAQVGKSTWPDDEKLIMLREIMPYAKDKKEKSSVLRSAGNLRTFLSLVFVSGYLDDPELSSAASRSSMQIALPTSDAKPGLTGIEVRNVLQRMLDKLTGQDSQYERIDIQTYLDKMPYTKGFESIFNGKDLSGWQGLVENPIIRPKLTKAVFDKKQQEANAKVKNNWSVKDGMIVFEGDGANLCTTRKYKDFEMIVDWKISRNGDSGIYLRGSPQIQIWDTSRVDVGAQVGSGGLYNNQKEPSKPTVVADNPIGEWNTFHITMIGDKVTVLLNGVLVVDKVTMENYWDRSLPIFPEEAIELQAHGTALGFRNIYVKELNPQPYELSSAEKEQGFQVLFDGKDLDNWVGNKVDYVVEDNTIAIYPGKESHGNLYTEKEYGDFIFRFQFQLTPGANNGLGIHAPLEGDAAYVGKEIQILDNTSSQYDKLKVYQYHGSVYGVIPAKREFLKPVGEWNEEEVYVKGDYIKVTLNGTVITEGDMKKASKSGTLDHQDHPGLARHSGHIGFLGHGTVVKFKSLRVKEITK